MRVEAAAVSKAFGDRSVLTDINVSMDANGITAITGPSGAGKSTLLAIIGGAMRPDHGTVTIHREGTAHPASSRFTAWVPQGSNALPHRTVRDNAAIGALSRGTDWDEAYAAADEALERVKLGRLLHHRAKQLSGGELQRLSFARALCAERPLILADEPTANLDEENTRGIADILRGLAGHSAVIVATHDPLMIAAADQVIDVRRLNHHDAA